MAETSNDDVAGDLIGRLQSDADLVGRGQFTLDIDEARDKLARYQLASPERFVLLLVEAAHSFPSCTSIGFEIDDRGTRARLAGVSLDEAELRGILDPLFIDADALESEDRRRMLGRRRLALAVNTMLGLADAAVVLRSHRPGHSSVELSISTRRSTVETAATRASMPVLELELGVQRSPLVDPQRTVLRGDARHSSLPLTLDGERIDIGLTHPGLAAPLDGPSELREGGQVVGRGGWWATGIHLAGGSVFFVANGVLVETLTDPELTRGYLALVRADDLERDLSQARLVRDAAFERRLATVLEHHAGVGPAPRLAPLGGEAHAAKLQAKIGGGGLVLGLICIALAVLDFALINDPDDGVSPGLSFVVGLTMTFIGNRSLEKFRRHLRVRQEGLPFVATIEAVKARTAKAHAGNPNIELRLEIDGRADRSPSDLVTLNTVVEGEHGFTIGDAYLVRVDPEDPDFAVFESAD